MRCVHMCVLPIEYISLTHIVNSRLTLDSSETSQDVTAASLADNASERGPADIRQPQVEALDALTDNAIFTEIPWEAFDIIYYTH